jgi:TetR/AcrR family fatty acid metabolism transcriptional regulator
MRVSRAVIACPGRTIVPVISARRKQDRYDSILDAAKSVFAERGFAGASISDIARRAAVSDGLVYRYFENKRDLLYHVLRVFYERIIEDLEATVLRETRFEARLRKLIRRHLEVFVSDADLCRLFISEVRVASDYQGSAIQELNRSYTSILIRIVDAALADGTIRRDVNPHLLRDVIFGAIEHRAWRFVNGRGDLDTARTARELTKLLVNGMNIKDAAA